jgi:hypothetical protein
MPRELPKVTLSVMLCAQAQPKLAATISNSVQLAVLARRGIASAHGSTPFYEKLTRTGDHCG